MHRALCAHTFLFLFLLIHPLIRLLYQVLPAPSGFMPERVADTHGQLQRKLSLFVKPVDTLLDPVSYTHLDVYKRQALNRFICMPPLC